MSDTLQEQEDYGPSNPGWCSECQGYTHMPWCDDYVEPEHVHDFKQVEGQSVPQCDCGAVHAYNTEHKPAARAEGDEWRCSHSDKTWHVHQNKTDVACNHDYIAIATTRKHAAQIVRDHNQHQSLVAERGQLLHALRRMLDRTPTKTPNAGARSGKRAKKLET